MREIEKLAQEKFDGDTYKALDYAYRTWGSKDNINDRMRKLYSELNDEELKMACQIIRNLAIERSGKEKVEHFERSVNQLRLFGGSLDFSLEEIKESKVNPYRNPLLISISALFLSVIVPILLYAVTDISVKNIIETIQIILIVLSSTAVVNFIIKFLSFKKAKKAIQNIDEI